ncbi:hypothetical protein CU098_010672, partial [Rhizopus stolonifer]
MSLAPESFQQLKPQLSVYYKLDEGKKIKHKNEAVPFVSDAIQVTSQVSPHTDNKGGYLLTFKIKALKPVELCRFQVQFMTSLEDQRMLANGFQSWSQARELSRNDKIPAIHSSIA